MNASWVGMLTLAAVVGASVGLSELLSRYAWSIKTIVSTGAGWWYLAINGFVAALAYQAAIDWGISVGLTGKPEWWRAVIVALLSMAFLRSAFANIRIGDRNVGVGLVTFVEVFKTRAERQLDQRLTQERWTKVGSVVADLTYESAGEYLVSVTMTILPSLTDAEREIVLRDTSKIRELEVESGAKMLMLAMCLERWLGQELLSQIAADASKRFLAVATEQKRQAEARRQRLSTLKQALGE